MPIRPGSPVFGGDTAETRNFNDGITAGDAVGTDANGDAALADSNAGIQATGVARHDADNPQGTAVGIDGAFVVSVAAGIVDGDRLDTPDASLADEDAGALAADAAGRFQALSDEGGTWHGEDGTYDVPDGYAVVEL